MLFFLSCLLLMSSLFASSSQLLPYSPYFEQDSLRTEALRGAFNLPFRIEARRLWGDLAGRAGFT